MTKVNIIGICRFSMIGRGDWKAFRKVDESAYEKIFKDKEVELFEARRMEVRLNVFEHVTLASLDAQSDPNFRFLVVSSDRMPAEYQERLSRLCEARPYVVLKFVAPMHISDAVQGILAEMDLPLGECLQFRLDDDDCVSMDYVRKLRKNGDLIRQGHSAFAVSFPNVIYSVIDGDTKGLYRWFNPFLGIGVAVCHPTRTVFGFAHYKIPTLLVALTDPSVPSIVTHYGLNDTPRHEAAILRKRGMVKTDLADLEKLINRHFPFLDDEGRKAAGLI